VFDGKPAVVKYFKNEDDRREILNYKILKRYDIPTIKPYEFGNATLVIEDITASEIWRLGIADDLNDSDVALALAKWYFTFHENGVGVSELKDLYFEYDKITEDNLKQLIVKLPEAEEVFRFLLSNLSTINNLIYQPSFTLTYNDFYWTNFIVRKDKKEAMMFDYNILGRGYRFSDFRNVCSSLSDDSAKVFIEEYNRLYLDKHGKSRTDEEKAEERIDDVMAPVYTLIVACLERDVFPEWAEYERNEAINGNLLSKAKQLLSYGLIK